MDKDSKQVVVLLTHPNIKESRANKALMDAISDMGEVAIYNLYEMRVEDAFNAEIWSTIISHASALVFQFPFYWMSAPSLLKRWLDEVFTYLAKTPAVAGKTFPVASISLSLQKDEEPDWDMPTHRAGRPCSVAPYCGHSMSREE
jgi:glutathione-regulated potassium-efflux system ancillary protein KefG